MKISLRDFKPIASYLRQQSKKGAWKYHKYLKTQGEKWDTLMHNVD